MEQNQLSGEIPVELYNPNIIRLRLTENNIKGTIRTEIGTMSNLTDYTVGSSKMSAIIPSELSNVSNLKVLDLQNASFTGPLPEITFQNLTQLLIFEVSDNDFTGPIPVDAIMKMTNLERLELDGNEKLTGTLPESICDVRGFDAFELQILFL